MKRDLAANFFGVTGLGRALASTWRDQRVVVLNYHRIGDGSRSEYDRELWSATEEVFDEQVAFLARHCDVIGPGDIEAALGSRRGRHVLITFDDGYLDNYELAFPVLRRHGVPAVFFVATGFIDRPSLPWWDAIACRVRRTHAARLDLRPWIAEPLVLSDDSRAQPVKRILTAYKSLPEDEARRLLARLAEETAVDVPERVDGHWMDWDMLREMSRAGMTIGGHTVNHPVLARLAPGRQAEEIEGCAARIAGEIGRPMEYFAYPVGSRDAFDDATEECLGRLGVRYAFSYYGGIVSPSSRRYDMQRVAVESDVHRNLFRSMLQVPRVFCREP